MLILRIPSWMGGWRDTVEDPAVAITPIPPTHCEHYQQNWQVLYLKSRKAMLFIHPSIPFLVTRVLTELGGFSCSVPDFPELATTSWAFWLCLDVFIEQTEGMKLVFVFVKLNFSNHESRIKTEQRKCGNDASGYTWDSQHDNDGLVLAPFRFLALLLQLNCHMWASQSFSKYQSFQLPL